MARQLSVYDVATLAHREMQRVTPPSALAEQDDDEELSAILEEEDSGTAQVFFSRLDAIEQRQRAHEEFLKLILQKLS